MDKKTGSPCRWPHLHFKFKSYKLSTGLVSVSVPFSAFSVACNRKCTDSASHRSDCEWANFVILAVILQVLYGTRNLILSSRGTRTSRKWLTQVYCNKKPYKISDAGVISNFEFPHRIIPTGVESMEIMVTTGNVRIFLSGIDVKILFWGVLTINVWPFVHADYHSNSRGIRD